MASDFEDLDPAWDNMDRAMGQLFLMGWEGEEITPQIRSLIAEFHLGSIILVTKNLKSAHDVALLVQELQTIAKDAGHPVPLLIAMDQENGGVNSLYDEDYICQYPSAMGIAATGSVDMAFDVAKATAVEISAVGVNMILGPVFDVLSNAPFQPLGVRATGDDPQEASQYGIAMMNGYKEGGVVTCGKHFPSYGNLNFLGSALDMPIITETLEQLSLSALVPFRNAISAGVDAIMVGGCAITNTAMNVPHACLSEQVVDDLLRQDLGFNGVVISECLEMDALSVDIGFRGGTVMAVEAGCDLVLLCRSFSVQREAMSGLKIGVDTGMVSPDRIRTSLKRVLKLKKACTSWEVALNPPGLSLLSKIRLSHRALSTRAYDHSITVMRDNNQLLPLSETLDGDDELLLLTPLLKPLPASAATKFLAEGKSAASESDRWMDRGSIMSGEGTFRSLGRALAKRRHGKLLHTSYTANGVRPTHENLIERASTIIVVTADANRNLYQNGFAKHVNILCQIPSSTGKKKSLIVVSVSSPYDFSRDKTIGTYICTYDFTETSMAALVRVLFGELVPQGTLPGTLRKSKKIKKNRQNWLVEKYVSGKDSHALDTLLETINQSTPRGVISPLFGAKASSFELSNPETEESHFVVRNSSTKALYGFCATYVHANAGYIGCFFVDPGKRNLSIGQSLCKRAVRGLLFRGDIKELVLGIPLPTIYPGFPLDPQNEHSPLQKWFATYGWHQISLTKFHSLTIHDLYSWSPPSDLVVSVQKTLPVEFELVHGLSYLKDISTHLSANASWEIMELYKMALADADACGVVVAKHSSHGTVIGTVIVCQPGTRLSTYVPLLLQADAVVGGVLAPVVGGSEAEKSLLLQGLLLLAIRQNKVHKASMTYLNLVDNESLNAVLPLGFEVLHSFEQLFMEPERSSVVT